METAERNVKANVRRLRTQRGWTLAELSAALDTLGHPMSVKVLNKLESFEPSHARGVSVDDFVALTKVFRVLPEDLLMPAAITREMTEVAELVAQRQRILTDRLVEVDTAKLGVAHSVLALAEAGAELLEALTEFGRLVEAQGLQEPDAIALLSEHWSKWTGERVGIAQDTLDEAVASLDSLGPLAELLNESGVSNETIGRLSESGDS